jgi:hypothetical protein
LHENRKQSKKRKYRKRCLPCKSWDKSAISDSKKVYDALDLNTGDYMEIVVQNNHLVLTPKTLIDKDTLQGLKEIREGKGIGPFSNAKDAIKALRS